MTQSDGISQVSAALSATGSPMIPPSFDQELDSLGWGLAVGTLTYPGYQDALALVIKRHFQCSTVMLWQIHGVKGERTLHSLGRYDGTGKRLTSNEALPEIHLGPYFGILSARGVYACVDTLDDRNLDGMGGRYLRSGAPRAFLDTLISVNGRALGVVSCCQDFDPRQWKIVEEARLKRFGARVALHLTRLVPSVLDSDCLNFAGRNGG